MVPLSESWDERDDRKEKTKNICACWVGFLDWYVYFSPGETVEVWPNTLSSRLEDITIAHLLTKGEKHKHYSL